MKYLGLVIPNTEKLQGYFMASPTLGEIAFSFGDAMLLEIQIFSICWNLEDILAFLLFDQSSQVSYLVFSIPSRGSVSSDLIEFTLFIEQILEVFGFLLDEDARDIAGPIRAGFFDFITALRKETHVDIRRGKECAEAFPKFLIASPSFHGGRGALPSAGGHPADLTCLAGGVKYNAASEQSKCPLLPLRGVKIPIYQFGSQSAADDAANGGFSCIPKEEESLLDSLLLALWEDRTMKGLLRYDVTMCELKVIGGRINFVAQFNEGWNSDCFPELEEKKVCLQLKHFTCNCLKLHKEELLFCLASGEKENPELIHSTTVPNDATMIIINANPVEYGHVFVVPRGFNSLPQFLDARSLEMIVRVAVEINNCSFRVFYDCSTSSASHPYFQACYFANPLPVELMQSVTVFADQKGRGIHICNVKDYPIKTVLFKGNGKVLVEVVAEICSCLQDEKIPYSLLISNCGEKVYLFPQLHTLGTTSTLSAWECGGHFLFKERCDFNQATEEALLKRLGDVSLDDEGFEVVKQLCCNVASKLVS
ncbi:hypothetical protein HHK36_003206 [Tetracentron sinense]|uniref:GDP-L-galactose phosphorylase 1 n=1 Tax=Tetracentron sinense TaxID=13715 RepID=A0A835DRW6_TETSI|nr:hypothetical protein HHK36_003206 [Tetracentron sinense]